MNLPADLEPHLTDGYEQLHDPGCYALRLTRPDNPEWQRYWETRPPWWPNFVSAPAVAYVGATGDVLGRLEDHAHTDKRQASLLVICEIAELLAVEWHDSPFEREFNMAQRVRENHPDWYVHSR